MHRSTHLLGFTWVLLLLIFFYDRFWCRVKSKAANQNTDVHITQFTHPQVKYAAKNVPVSANGNKKVTRSRTSALNAPQHTSTGFYMSFAVFRNFLLIFHLTLIGSKCFVSAGWKWATLPLTWEIISGIKSQSQSAENRWIYSSITRHLRQSWSSLSATLRFSFRQCRWHRSKSKFQQLI